MTVSHRKLFSQGDAPSSYVTDESDVTEMKLHVYLQETRSTLEYFHQPFKQSFVSVSFSFISWDIRVDDLAC